MHTDPCNTTAGNPATFDLAGAADLWQWIHQCLGDAVMRIFHESSACVVGGSVRDWLLHRIPKDLDLVCRDAEAVARRIAQICNATIVPFLKNRDMPCFRIVLPHFRPEIVDISPIFGGTLQRDLKRRDFTVNAMAIPVHPDGSAPLIDLHNGARDLKDRMIRMTTPQALMDDPLRVLRAIRFAAQLDFSVHPLTLAWMSACRNGMADVSAERIWQELLAVLSTGRVSWAFQVLSDLRLTDVILPEMAAMKGCRQGGYHHLDVWRHTLLVAENVERILARLPDWFPEHVKRIAAYFDAGHRRALLQFGALLHDIGKPATRRIQPETENVTFRGHQGAGAEMTSAIARRLRLSTDDERFLTLIVSEHMHPFALSMPDVTPGARMKWFRACGEDVIPLIIHAMADVMSTQGVRATPAFHERFLSWSSQAVRDFFHEALPRFTAPNLISGHDLMALGLPAGPRIGAILKAVREGQDAGFIKTREEALEMAGWLLGACEP